jgi:hypothetical protein
MTFSATADQIEILFTGQHVKEEAVCYAIRNNRCVWIARLTPIVGREEVGDTGDADHPQK